MSARSVLIAGQTGPIAITGAEGFSPDEVAADAFGWTRVSSPTGLFESKLIADEEPFFWDKALVSGAGITGTYKVNQSAVDIDSTLNTAGNYIRQTFQRFDYNPGKSHLVYMTGTIALSGLSSGGEGVSRRIGLFDDNDGVFFEENEGVVYVVVRSSVGGSVSETRVGQNNWNVDAFDGSGPSEVITNWENSQNFVIDLQWLAVGRVRFGLMSNGRIAYCHTFAFENTLPGAYMLTPNLPLRYQMETTASSPAHSMRVICSTVQSEGADDILGTSRCVSNDILEVQASLAGTIYALVGVRQKSTHLGTILRFASASVNASTPDDAQWIAYINPTIAGTVTWTPLVNSAAEVAIFDGTNTITPGSGTRVSCGYFTRTSSIRVPIDNVRYLGAAIDGTRDFVVLAVMPRTAGLDALGSLSWREST